MSDYPTSQYPVPDFTPPDDEPPQRRGYWSSTPPWYVMMVAAILIVMLAILLILLFRDDGTETTAGEDTTTSITQTTVETTATVPTTTGSSTTSSSTTEPSSSTTTSTSTSTSTTSTTTPPSTSSTSSSTSTTVDPAVFETAVWPWIESTTRYDDPVEAAKGFALDFLGFDQVFAGQYVAGDSRSGELEIRQFRAGPTTTVFVRQLGPDDTWWVLGSATENIRIDEPDALAEIDSPLTVSGESVAFEAVVNVELRVDGSTTPLVDGIVMGGGTELLPFEETFTFDDPDEGRGALVLFTISARDGEIQEASVLRVVFGS